ncbi:DUF2987 domain-containing protein [Oceanisphaera avium]|uniref:DUF2987 domain-containing protein n=1 Tax=Oceanisphaera avium TaxID=1903694 RepID=A0A1Y0CWB7_9GAMM|nr:DUF2987 domain-containing protein [Oceanisphaera avium]ART79304.1 hypothetical protein CBP12_03375 [Oceanisphaera avium]
MKFALILPLIAVFASSTLHATTLEMDYSGFYKYMAKVDKAKVEQAQLGFYLSRYDGEGLCTITSGAILVDEEVRGEVNVLAHGQFTLTKDKELDLDKARVVLEVVEDTQCDISIQIQANLEQGTTNMAALREVEADMYQLLQTMAGWPGKYFVPDLQGIKLNPAQPDTLIQGENQLKLSQSQLAESGQLDLPKVRITPWF